jgi:hypothetical protein
MLLPSTICHLRKKNRNPIQSRLSRSTTRQVPSKRAKPLPTRFAGCGRRGMLNKLCPHHNRRTCHPIRQFRNLRNRTINLSHNLSHAHASHSVVGSSRRVRLAMMASRQLLPSSVQLPQLCLSRRLRQPCQRHRSHL